MALRKSADNLRPGRASCAPTRAPPRQPMVADARARVALTVALHAPFNHFPLPRVPATGVQAEGGGR
jgi:hypothetical protein